MERILKSFHHITSLRICLTFASSMAWENWKLFGKFTLRGKCTYSEFFWWILRFAIVNLRIQSKYRKYGPEKLRIRALFTQISLNYKSRYTGFPLVGELGGIPPTTQKIDLSSYVPHCFAPKMLILWFSCSFWPFCPNCSPTSRPLMGNPFTVFCSCCYFFLVRKTLRTWDDTYILYLHALENVTKMKKDVVIYLFYTIQ